MRTLRLLLTMLLLASSSLYSPGPVARKVKLTHKVPSQSTVAAKQRERDARQLRKTQEVDSVTFTAMRDSIGFSGFDKTTQATKETFFVTNSTSRHICGLTVEIEYRDMSGRMLHRREVELDADIPAGETRMVGIPALDRQKSLYYHRSRPPRSGGMPFDVSMTLRAIRVPL